MDEFAAIAEIFAPLAAAEPGALGLADDAAILDLPAGLALVVTKDVMAANVHFLADDPPDLIARKLVRVNVSDLAAMGAAPRWYVLGLTLPSPVDMDWLRRFGAGLALDQTAFGITLVGGDTTAHRGPLTLSLTAMGTIERGKALLRSGARAGDDVWVSGTLGDGALGLRVLRGELAGLGTEHRLALADRYHVPRPRVALGRALGGLANAAIDVSDGLLADLGHISETSALAATIIVDALPLSDAARSALALLPELRADVLAGGDDYELLFTAAPRDRARIEGLESVAGVALTRIGGMGAGRGVRLEDMHGRPVTPPPRGGWTHF